jgi:CDP-diacylglycerol--glycerol-3-phosphate 3-phosphatidyltransferase
MNWTIPNILSLSRIVIAPIFLWLFLSGDLALQQFSIVLYILGAITDYYDGYFARKLNQMSSFGKFVDPLADKLHTSAAFIAFLLLNIIPFWMVIIIILRDFGTTLLRIMLKKEFKTSVSAKLKTTLQFIFIGAILVMFYIKDMYPNEQIASTINKLIYSDVTYYSMFLITVLTVWTFVDYLKIKKAN